MILGMAVIFQVGELDAISKDFKTPKDFPQCRKFDIHRIDWRL